MVRKSKKIDSVEKEQKTKKKRLSKKSLKNALLFGIYIAGIYTTMTFFFSFIGLLIGISYFLLFRDKFWKRSGLVLAWTASLSTLVLNGIALNNSAGNPSISTVYVNLALGPIMIITSGIIYLIWRKWRKNKRRKARLSYIIRNLKKNLTANARVHLTIHLVLFPVAFWFFISVDLGVLFDNKARLLWVNVPSTAQNGSEFEITVEAWDPYERLSATYTGRVEFSIISYNLTTYTQLSSINATLPDDYKFTGQFFGSDMAYEIRDGRDNGLHVFTARIDTPGIHYILVEDSFTDNTYWSNPIIVDNFTNTASNIYWGDIHGHSGFSDGSGSPEHHYYYARSVACLDFNALTDHGEAIGMIPGGLDHVERVTNNYYNPGEFVAFHGIEWTNAATGHYTCVFSGNKVIKKPLLSFFVITSTQQLWNALDSFTDSTGCHALALPHHTTKEEYPQDWTLINPKYVKIAEVTSVHGECLFAHRDPYNYVGMGDPPPQYTSGSAIMDAFKMGYRMTLYASSDEHDGHPGHSLSHTNAYIGHQRPWTTWPNRADLPYPGGITAVYTSELTRDAVFTGLENQTIYASSDHGRPFLNFNINGTRVGNGSTLKVSNATSAREINIVIAQDGAPAAGKRPKAASVTPNWIPNWDCTIEIFKNGELFYNESISTPIGNITIIDSAPIIGASFEDKCVEGSGGNYYINKYSDNPIDPSTLNTGGVDFYLIRVMGDNGRMAYAGPIWVEVGP